MAHKRSTHIGDLVCGLFTLILEPCPFQEELTHERILGTLNSFHENDVSRRVLPVPLKGLLFRGYLQELGPSDKLQNGVPVFSLRQRFPWPSRWLAAAPAGLMNEATGAEVCRVPEVFNMKRFRVVTG